MVLPRRAVVAACILSVAVGVVHDHAHALGASQGQKDGPIEKVIGLLMQNKMKVMSDLQMEQKEMAEYSSFCDTETGAKGIAITLAKRKIEDLDSTVEDAKAQIKGLVDEIASLGVQMAAKEKEVTAAAENRKGEHDDFVVIEKELLDSLDELSTAILVAKREQTAQKSLLQVSDRQLMRDPRMQAVAKSLKTIINAAWVDSGSKQYLQGLMQQSLKVDDGSKANQTDSSADDLRLRHKEPEKEEGAEPKADEKSSGIVGTFMDMKEKAEVTLSNARASEMKQAFGFQMMKQSLTETITLCKKGLSDAKSTSATLSEEAGNAEGELVETKKTKVADSMYLKSLTTECDEQARAWEERQKSASDEIAAIDKAKEILQSRVKAMLQFGDDGGSDGDEEADKVAERAAGVSQYDDEKDAKIRARLVGHLKEMGHEFHSYVMMEMVSAAATDPFEKIRGLLGDMIAKLIAEANEEQGQKEFCDEEKGKSNKAKDDLSTKIDKSTAELDKQRAETSKLTDTIKELQAELAETDKALGEAMKLRNEEHANFLKASKDYKDAAEAVEDAIGVLKEFYSGAALAQTSANKGKGASSAGATAPPKLGGKGDASEAIIALLETSAEDFTRLLSEEESKEMEAQATYTKMEMEAKVATMSKTWEMKAAQSQIQQLTVAIEQGTEDSRLLNADLDAVVAYLEKLRPQCETKVLTYEEKRAQRQSEIEGLKQALAIIEGEQPALVQRPRVLRGVGRF